VSRRVLTADGFAVKCGQQVPWAAVRDGQFKAALDLHVPIMTMHYEEAGTWIVGLKRLLALSAGVSAA